MFSPNIINNVQKATEFRKFNKYRYAFNILWIKAIRKKVKKKIIILKVLILTVIIISLLSSNIRVLTVLNTYLLTTFSGISNLIID